MRVKRFLSMFLAAVMLCALLPVTASAAFSQDDFTNSSWFGEFTGAHGTTPVKRYIDFTIDKCDSSGNFTGSAKITTVKGEIDDSAWCTNDFKGTIDFAKSTFYMETVRITAGTGGANNWIVSPFTAAIQMNAQGEMTLSGTYRNTAFSGEYLGDVPFFATRTSAWARDEMTQANILGLIPETLKDADMTKRITRAEFAAVSVKLYESLTGKTSTAASTPFTDIGGNSNRADIGKAYGLGIAVGVSDTEFAPDVAINREQLATMLCRTVKKYRFDGWTIDKDGQYYLDTSGVSTFADDADISGYAKPSVYYMAKMGIIKGVDDTHFAPQNITPEQEAQGYATATREQAIALSLRIYKLSDMLK